FLFYFAKFLLLLFTIIFQIGGLLVGGLAYLIPSLQFSGNYAPIFAKISVLLSVIPLLLMINGVLRNRHRYKLYEVEVPIKGLSKNLDGLKIVQISDVHSGSFTDKEPIKKGIELINSVNADLAFFTGDLVNSIATEIEPYVDVFDKIRAKYGVFSILGNHDYADYVRWPNLEMKRANLGQLVATQKKMGWDLLLNENRLLDINGEKVAIIGVENYSGSPRFSKYGDLRKAYQGSEKADLKLLLSHDPSHWDAQIVNNYADIAVTFSGHTHGAQFGIEIKNWFKWSPVQYVYKQWAGLYQRGTQYLYVNRGFGYLGYPGRVGILPEVTLMRLKSV
ncbi:MAG: metallophosphoesterase, partial [Bacteroidota bacterium]